MVARTHYDVVILGGGLAGLTLARQLKRARPETSVLVTERQQHPVPEAAYKVGESTNEVGAYYLSDVLGLKEHLETEQIRKLALRFFFTAGDNTDIVRRGEIGVSDFTAVPGYQIDRGRIENALWSGNRELGVDLLEDCKVRDVSFGAERHVVSLLRHEREFGVTARWVVDATGRAGLLKRKLGLAEEVGHDANAAWFRIGDMIAVDDWSDDPDWQARVPGRHRWRSTNHLMGRGYWVWLIPLSSGSISIGIVADAALHPFEEFNRFDRALEWLRKYEPQCANFVEDKRDKLQDFRVMKNFAYGCQRVFSPDRWCLTGESGVFTDPLFSPGNEFIAYANTFITDLVLRDLKGDAITGLVEFYNMTFLTIFRSNLAVYEGQYHLLGNPQVMLAKKVFGFAFYLAVIVPLYIHNKLTDGEFMFSILPQFKRLQQLLSRMETMFREWDELDQRQWADFYIDYASGVHCFAALERILGPGLDDDGVRAVFLQNMKECEALAVEICRKAAQLVPGLSERENVDPYSISLKEGQWHPEAQSSKESEETRKTGIAAEIHKIWLDEDVARPCGPDPLGGNRVRPAVAAWVPAKR
jgi:flavin-dependent dehydrogenase